MEAGECGRWKGAECSTENLEGLEVVDSQNVEVSATQFHLIECVLWPYVEQILGSNYLDVGCWYDESSNVPRRQIESVTVSFVTVIPFADSDVISSFPSEISNTATEVSLATGKEHADLVACYWLRLHRF